MKLSNTALFRGDFFSFLIGQAAFIFRDFCTERIVHSGGM